MKKTYLLLLAALVALVGLPSCGDDDDQYTGPNISGLVDRNMLSGIWKERGDRPADADYIVFNPDGTGTMVEYDKGVVTDRETFSWTYDDETRRLTIVEQYGDIDRYTIEHLDAEMLRLWDINDKDRETYSRVASLPSYGDDDQYPGPDISGLVDRNLFAGTWKENGDRPDDADYIVFNPDGTGTMVEYDKGYVTDRETFSWTYNDETRLLTIVEQYGDIDRYTVEYLDTEALRLWDINDKDRETYSRVASLPALR